MEMPPPDQFARPASPAQADEPATLAGALGEVLRWRPLWVVGGLLAVVLLAPEARKAMDPFGGTAPRDGVSVDTAGAEGQIDGGQFRLDLPLAVANRTDNVVTGVEMWTKAWDCPPLPGSRCRPMLSTGQDFALNLRPGGTVSLPTTLTGGAPPEAGPNDTVRIDRRIENIYDDRDSKRAEAQSAFR